MRKKKIVKFKETKKEKKWIITRGERRQETSSGRQWRMEGVVFFFLFSGSICAGSISWPGFITNASWQGFVIAKSIRGRKYNLPRANIIILPAPNYFHVRLQNQNQWFCARLPRQPQSDFRVNYQPDFSPSWLPLTLIWLISESVTLLHFVIVSDLSLVFIY